MSSPIVTNLSNTFNNFTLTILFLPMYISSFIWPCESEGQDPFFLKKTLISFVFDFLAILLRLFPNDITIHKTLFLLSYFQKSIVSNCPKNNTLVLLVFKKYAVFVISLHGSSQYIYNSLLNLVECSS